MMDVVRHIGQLFVVGFPGREPPETFLEFVAEEGIGGVILFEENCPSHQAVKETTHSLTAAAKPHELFVAIDQEGGRVCRLRGAPAEFPSPAEFGAHGDIERFREAYSRSAVFMRSLGINVNLAPVCDLMLHEDNLCLGGRCFGSDPNVVAPFAAAGVEVSSRTGLLSCLKHFPGLGASTIDPHHAVAVGNYDDVTWEHRERIPFAAGLAAGADLVMTTHLLLPRFDNIIATGSRKIVDELLRHSLSFDGPIITDDLTMKGAEALGELGPRTVTAFNAGHDLLLFGTDFEQAMRAYDHFYEAVKRREVSEERLRSALARVSGIKFKLDSIVLR